MRAIRSWWVAAVVVCTSCSAALGYTLDNLGRAGGWDKINGSDTVTTVLVTGRYTTDLASGRVDTAVRNAYATWDGVETAPKLNFLYKADNGGNYDALDTYPPSLDQASDWNYANIVFGGWLPQSYFTNVDPVDGSSILALTWTTKLRGGNGPRQPTWHAEVFFNDAWSWTDNPLAGDEFDIETVALHELGHTIGLGHEDTVPSVMGTYYVGVQRELYQDDINGVTALYGSGKGKGKPTTLGTLQARRVTSNGTDWYLTGVTYVPEPSGFVMAALGLLGLLGYLGLKRPAA